MLDVPKYSRSPDPHHFPARFLAEFRARSRYVNAVEGRALDHGYILGDDSEYYSSLGRWRRTGRHTRRASTHLEFMQSAKDDDERQGMQAYVAVTNALHAAVNAAGEWCPDNHDVEMLLELARQADPDYNYRTTLDPEIYTQYSMTRDGLPPHTPFTSRPEHRAIAEDDVRALLARTERLREAWPLPKKE